MVKLLIKCNDMDINLKNHCRQTALLLPAKNWHPEVVKLLIEHNQIDMKLTDYVHGETALSCAIVRGMR